MPIWIGAALLAAMAGPDKPGFDDYLRRAAVPRAVLDTFVRGPAWARFDPELGYTLGNYLPADGVDGSATISTTGPDGARTAFVYAGRPCRINTYGDSFTQCHQVSDGETWQEALAAHLGEPVRNFGMGGYGAYQSYRRLVREEQTKHAAEYVIYYIWGDDHVRSLLRCRHALIYPVWDHKGGRMFHNNPWAHLELDPSTGQWHERDNLLPTPESLGKLCDPEWLVEHLRDDLALELAAYKQGFTRGVSRERFAPLAARLGHPWAGPAAPTRDEAGALLDRYSLRATRVVLDKLRAFTAAHNKKLMVVLFDPYRVLPALVRGGPRYDQEVVDYLRDNKVRFFDMNEVHRDDFRRTGMNYSDYLKQYLIGHYNPRGNHFFAQSIKRPVVEVLDPKPVTYARPDPAGIDFRGYLPDRR